MGRKMKSLLGILVLGGVCASAAAFFMNRPNEFLTQMPAAKSEREQLELVASLHKGRAAYSCILFDSLGREIRDERAPYWIVLTIDGDGSVLFAPKSPKVSEMVLSDE